MAAVKIPLGRACAFTLSRGDRRTPATHIPRPRLRRRVAGTQVYGRYAPRCSRGIRYAPRNAGKPVRYNSRVSKTLFRAAYHLWFFAPTPIRWEFVDLQPPKTIQNSKLFFSKHTGPGTKHSRLPPPVSSDLGVSKVPGEFFSEDPILRFKC